MKNKINVNISPNPLDLQTLHCSQNDTEERKFYFTLHNNGEVIDTSDISDPIFEPFSVYKGGTEQLLPVNTDDPSTSPIIADIQYPDEEKTEQEFTYRESPTTLDGNAIIEKLYGNTLVWNQLVQNGNFANGVADWSANGTKSASDGVATWVPNVSSANFYKSNFPVTQGHYYLCFATVKLTTATNGVYIRFSGQSIGQCKSTTDWQTLSAILQRTSATGTTSYGIINVPNDSNSIQIKNMMLIDLTKMFESGNEPTTVEEFTSLYSLPYYEYTEGKLLSFGTPQQVTWNQLVDAPATSGDFDMQGVSVTYGTNTITLNSGTSINGFKTSYNRYDLTSGHKYAIWGSPKKSNVNNYYLYIADGSTGNVSRKAIFAEPVIYDCRVTENARLYVHVEANVTANHNVFQPQIVDLTVMYGSGKEPSIEYFKQNYSGYYPYDSGSTVSANVSGIKTVGKNLYQDGDVDVNNILFKSVTLTEPIKAGTYNISAIISHPVDTTGNRIAFRNKSGSGIDAVALYGDSGTRANKRFTVTEDIYIIYFYYSLLTSGSGNASFKDIQIEKGIEATSYEPYTSSTTSIPTLTYFPTGMKRAGDVFDELSNSKAVKRVNEYTIDGSDVSTGSTESANFYRITLTSNVIEPNNAYKIGSCNRYTLKESYSEIANNDKTMGFNSSGNTLLLHDSSLSNLQAVIDSLNANPIVFTYPLLEEVVTQFTQASLVCEDGESTLYQDVDSLVCDCTEDFSKDSGFKDCKIKFTNDDGVVYSNKIQLHIERKP